MSSSLVDSILAAHGEQPSLTSTQRTKFCEWYRTLYSRRKEEFTTHTNYAGNTMTLSAYKPCAKQAI